MHVSVDDLNEVLALAEKDLLSLKRARVFLTGGTGYIGCWILMTLLHADAAFGLGLRVTVLSRSPRRFAERQPHLALHPSVEVIEGDVRDFMVAAASFTHVIHGATDVIAQQSPLDTFDVTVGGTRRVLDLAKRCSAQRVLLMSSGAVYGRVPKDVDLISEEHAGGPASDSLTSAYGIGKLASEWLGTAFSEPGGITCASARIFAQIGPMLALDKQFAAGNFLLNALRREPLVIKGDGTPLRSYMYPTDLVTWLLAILTRAEAGRAYNVGSSNGVSISELAEKIALEAGQPTESIRVLGESVPGAAPDRYVPDTTRATSELGVRLTVPLDCAIRRTYDWCRNNQR